MTCICASNARPDDHAALHLVRCPVRVAWYADRGGDPVLAMRQRPRRHKSGESEDKKPWLVFTYGVGYRFGPGHERPGTVPYWQDELERRATTR